MWPKMVSSFDNSPKKKMILANMVSITIMNFNNNKNKNNNDNIKGNKWIKL